MSPKKIEHGNKVNWKKTKLAPNSQSYAVTTGVSLETRDLMEHFAAKMVMMGWIKHMNMYSVAKFALESYFAGLADAERLKKI